MELRYKLIKRANRRHFIVRWYDERDAKWREKSLKVSKRREAEKIAERVIQAERNRWFETKATNWEVFRTRYESEHGPTLASLGVWKSAAKHFETICLPADLTTITKGTFSTFEAGLRKLGLRDETIRSYIKHVMAAINWAVEVELIPRSPRVKLPRRTSRKIMKGRPITGEEFDRLIEAAKSRPTFKPLLNGLWLSGLRLSEALSLHWERTDLIHVENVDGRRPVLRIPELEQKSRQETISPLTPDFVEYLRKLKHRTGPVFCPEGDDGPLRTADRVSRLISALGKQAKIIVDRDPKTDRVKWASAHDLRRSFGDRWAQRVMPAVLKELMRHKSIETTMTYYVGRSAEQTADVLWNLPKQTTKRGCQSHPRKRSSRPE